MRVKSAVDMRYVGLVALGGDGCSRRDGPLVSLGRKLQSRAVAFARGGTSSWGQELVGGALPRRKLITAGTQGGPATVTTDIFRDSVTPEPVYLRRREFMRVTSLAALAALLNACGGPGGCARGYAGSQSAGGGRRDGRTGASADAL